MAALPPQKQGGVAGELPGSGPWHQLHASAGRAWVRGESRFLAYRAFIIMIRLVAGQLRRNFMPMFQPLSRPQKNWPCGWRPDIYSRNTDIPRLSANFLPNEYLTER